MLEKKYSATADLSKLIDIRTDFLNYLDENIPKKNNNIEYDFTNNPSLRCSKKFMSIFLS